MTKPKNKKPKQQTDNADNLSLADLLSADSSSSDSGPQNVDEREDEPDSGLLRLSKMVASSSLDSARSPSPLSDATPTGGINVAAHTTSSMPPAPALSTDDGGDDPMSNVAQANASSSSSKAPLYLIAVAIIAAVGAFIWFMQTEKAPETNPELLALKEKINELEKHKQEAETVMADTQIQAKEQEIEELRAKMQKLEEENNAKKQVEEAKREEEPTDKQADEQEEQKPEPADKKDVVKQAKKQDKRAVKVAKAKPAPKKAARPKPEPAKKLKKQEPKANKPATNDKTAALDSLLGGSKKDETQKTAPKAASGLPQKPDRAAVKAAMAPIIQKAQKCSKYSTGTVQVRLKVKNNGRVQASSATGTFAGTTAGKCVEMLARTAKFPKFANNSFSVVYPVTLR